MRLVFARTVYYVVCSELILLYIEELQLSML